MLSQQDGPENSGWAGSTLEKRNVESGQLGWTMQATGAPAGKMGAKVCFGLDYAHNCGISIPLQSFSSCLPPGFPQTSSAFVERLEDGNVKS